MQNGKNNKNGWIVSNLFLSYQTLISPLGTTIPEHVAAFKARQTAIAIHPNAGFNQSTLPVAKIAAITNNRYDAILKMAIEALKKQTDLATLQSDETLFIVSSTKGNMDAFDTDAFQSTRTILSEELAIPHAPLIISNACISGVLAINTAADYLKTDRFKDVFIIGIDAVSDFVLFGFQSLYALSDGPCKPFDKERTGTSLGEACGIVRLSVEPTKNAVEYLGGTSSNDANHISGPSRTGEGLYRAVNRAIKLSGIQHTDIDFISAHGTGTVFNDEMESIAFGRLEMDQVPVNSMKGYFGHTLGAAGVIETIMTIVSMQENTLFESLGYSEPGTSQAIQLITSTKKAPIHIALKTASGFGGGNAALILKKQV